MRLTYGGYPGCKPQISKTTAVRAPAASNATMSQTGAKGTYEHSCSATTGANQALVNAAAAKVINVPGCPTNPWWFVLSVVMVMLKLAGTDLIELDYGRRIKKVYPGTVHSAFCPRYPYYTKGIYATQAGSAGLSAEAWLQGHHRQLRLRQAWLEQPAAREQRHPLHV